MKLLDTSVIIGLLRGEEKIEKLVANEKENYVAVSPYSLSFTEEPE